MKSPPPPFIIEAIGDAESLKAALKLPNGILDNLKNQSGLGVRINTADRLQLPAAAEGLPQLKEARIPVETSPAAIKQP